MVLYRTTKPRSLTVERWLSAKAAGSTPAGALSYDDEYDDEYDNDVHIHYHHYYCVSNMDL